MQGRPRVPSDRYAEIGIADLLRSPGACALGFTICRLPDGTPTPWRVTIGPYGGRGDTLPEAAADAINRYINRSV